MAGKIRYLLFVDGRYYARRVVPQELRSIVGKRELQEPLGADRRSAIDQLPVALIRIAAKLDHAQAVRANRLETNAAERASRSSLLSPAELARVHYQERIAIDLAFRQAGPTWASIGIDDRYVADLRAVLAGRLDSDEIEQVMGDILERYLRRGNISAEPRSPAWRETAQAIAGAELEALERVVERDEGADPKKQVHPAHLAPAVIDETPIYAQEPLSLRGLLEAHLSALERQGRGRAGRRAWPNVFEDLVQFLADHRGLKGNTRKHADDARRLTGVNRPGFAGGHLV
ncbi:MAG: hypothetical protein IPK28_18905 [Devosia sp.]|nr:hypothetical protein [Devosia sp.]